MEILNTITWIAKICKLSDSIQFVFVKNLYSKLCFSKCCRALKTKCKSFLIILNTAKANNFYKYPENKRTEVMFMTVCL